MVTHCNGKCKKRIECDKATEQNCNIWKYMSFVKCPLGSELIRTEYHLTFDCVCVAVKRKWFFSFVKGREKNESKNKHTKKRSFLFAKSTKIEFMMPAHSEAVYLFFLRISRNSTCAHWQMLMENFIHNKYFVDAWNLYSTTWFDLSVCETVHCTTCGQFIQLLFGKCALLKC